MKVPVLAYVEDPGAANFLAALPEALRVRKTDCILLASGLAVHHLANRNLDFTDISSSTLTAEHIVSRYDPSAIVCGTSENPETPAFSFFEVGKRRKIPTIGVVDMMVNSHKRFSGLSNEPLLHAPETIFVPDHPTMLAFESLGFPAGNIEIIGYPQFDFARDRVSSFRSKPKVPVGETYVPTIIFVAEPVSKLNESISFRNADYTLQGRGSTNFRTNIILEELIDAIERINLKVNLVVRLHPKNSIEEFDNYKNEIDGLSEGGDPLEVIYNCDFVIGMTSMLLQEAAWIGKPTLAILANTAEGERLAAIASGLTPSASTREELDTALTKFRDGEWPTPDPTQYFSSCASKKMADLVCSHMQASAPSQQV